MHFLKIVALTLYLFAFVKLAYAQQNAFNGTWVEIYHESTAEKARKAMLGI